jgi:parallel beta-helix repeat protein
VLVIDTASNTVTATVSLPNNSFVTGIAVTPDGQHVYVENFTLTRPANSTVTVINTADDSVNTTIPANGDTLTALAITPDGSTVLAVNSVLSTTVNSSVLVIPTATNAIANSVTVGFFPISIATTTLGTDIVKCPTVITQPGTYKVANDLHCFNTNGIDIRADNVTLMLGGHTITQDAAHFGFAGRGVNAGVGLATGNSNVQIFGPGTITGFNRGVDFEQVSNSLVKNVTTTGNFFGFAVNGGFSAGCGASCPSTGNLFRGNISTLNNQHGFTMNGATNNVFNANDASSNGAHGFLLFVASGNNVQGNTFNNNGQSGIIIASGTGTGNNLHQNTAQNNGIVDLEDDNPNCGSNTWNQNIFGTASQPCIQ